MAAVEALRADRAALEREVAYYPEESASHFQLGLAFAAKQDIDKAIEAYRKLITFDPKGQDRRMHNPIYHYRLAKLYDAKGMKDAARGEYQKLLEDWKDADSGIPELVDAKKRLGM